MLRVILVDDERLARQAMRQLLEEHPDVAVIGEAASAMEARRQIVEEKPDAIFLDIQMPGRDGFDLLEGLESPPKVVFVTAHAEHALRAFEFDAVDYLLKPVRPERLKNALRRLQMGSGVEASLQEESVRYQLNDRICLRTPGKTLVAMLEDVIALQAEGDFTRVFVAGETPLLICHSLGSYERELPSPPFLRLDRSLMINATRLGATKQVTRDETQLHLEGIPNPFTIGRTGWSRLKKSGVLKTGSFAIANP